jgi:hypothetical protein
MFSSSAIIKDDTMLELIERRRDKVLPERAPRMAIQSLRSVVGVFKYMQEPEVARIFRDEKVRIGAMIDGIDRTLPQNPRQIDGRPGGLRTFTPWQTLGLGAKWDTYMNDVFATARDKGISFLDDNIQRLNAEYTSQAARDKAIDDPSKSAAERAEIAAWAALRRDIAGYITALETEWANVRNWARPW